MIGVVIVSYCSGDVIGACLDSLMTSEFPDLRVVVCDNASLDNSVEVLQDWAAAAGANLLEHPDDGGDYPLAEKKSDVTLVRSATNLGFAGGVNLGIKTLYSQQDIDLFWVLNPDCVVAPDCASAYAEAARAAPEFSLMGGRTLYLEAPNHIQSDGGRVSPWTGICHNMNQGLLPGQATPPETDSLDFISGANVVATRTFIERAGLMVEDYFLYYEEVDWAARRGDLPLRFCQNALVYHHGGTSIGSGSVTRRASGFSNYFNYRNRMRFIRRFNWPALPVAYVYSLLKTVKLLLTGALDEASGAFRGLHGLSPGSRIREKLSPDARELAFARGYPKSE